MTSRERVLATLDGRSTDYVPMTTWSFGFRPPPGTAWRCGERAVDFWYTMRLEHLHTLPQPWTLDDDFNRARAWRKIGVDDFLEISVPWSIEHGVTYSDKRLPAGHPEGDAQFPVMVRDYNTPSGPVHHAVRRTPDEGPGWPCQPDHVPCIEDYNIPRAVCHPVTIPDDISRMRHLFAPPDKQQRKWFVERMRQVQAIAVGEGYPVQAWSAFGMDAAVWFCGTQGAIMLAMDYPEAFGRLMEQIAATDYARTELAVQTPGIDMVCQRGWYSSTDFWSPDLFDLYVMPHLRQLTSLAHRHGRKFGYVMTTGVATLGPRLADAGVDLLYFVDPFQDRLTIETARDLLGGRMTLVGGMNSTTLCTSTTEEIRSHVRHALKILGPTNRFILHPVDALFPDTPWHAVEAMIAAWKEYR